MQSAAHAETKKPVLFSNPSICPSGPTKTIPRALTVVGVLATILFASAAVVWGEMPARSDEHHQKRLILDGPTMRKKLIHEVKPIYPPEAKEKNIHGTVRLEIVVGTDGAVKFLKVLSGHPVLARAALDAVRQWKYLPTTLEGQPVEVGSKVEAHF